jgi:putative transposon-encoded protein
MHRVRTFNTVDNNRKRISKIRPKAENEVALKRDADEIRQRPKGSGVTLKAKFTVVGEEMIEKQVKPGGNAGRVYLPLVWVGKFVKIIRID